MAQIIIDITSPDRLGLPKSVNPATGKVPPPGAINFNVEIHGKADPEEGAVIINTVEALREAIQLLVQGFLERNFKRVEQAGKKTEAGALLEILRRKGILKNIDRKHPSKTKKP